MSRYKNIKRLTIELSRAKTMIERYRVRTEATLNSLGEGLIAINESGKITTVNPYALNCLGYTASELLGTWFPKSVVAVDAQGTPLDGLDRPVLRALTTGRPVSEKSFYLRKDGSKVPVFITVAPVVHNNQPAGAIEVFRDLTEEHQLDLAKDEFVSLASHQLRTPATGVKLILDMLKQGDFGALTPTQQQYIEKAIQSNNRQLDIIEDLLHVARIASGKMKLERQRTDLTSLIQQSQVEYTSILGQRQQTLQLDIPDHCIMDIDCQKIQMVIDNLVSNASKYSPPHSQIHLCLKKNARLVEISVTDQGVGISPDDIGKLFTKFTRLENEFSHSVGGSGLGLFVLKSIVELHHGSVSVQSRPGAGSTFTVLLPRHTRLQEALV